VNMLLALLAVGTFAAQDAPVISLDLSGTAHDYNASHVTHGVTDHNPLTSSRKYASSDYSATRTFADEISYPACVGSAAQCGFSSNPTLPNATAYDHHDGSSIVVVTTITLFSEMTECVGALSATDACPSENNLVPKSEEVHWENATVKRGQYIVDYQAADAAGNDADAVLFALIITDHTCPVASLTTSAVEYGATTQSVGLSAVDNYDTAVLGPETATFTTCQSTAMVTSAEQTKSFADYAGIFGLNNANNFCDTTFTLNIVDETPPVIDSVSYTGTDDGEHECATSTGINKDISAATVAVHDPNVVEGCYGHELSKANYFSFNTPTYVGDSVNTCANLKSANDHTWKWGDNCTATYYAKDKSDNEATPVEKSWTVKDSFDPTVFEPVNNTKVDQPHHENFSFANKSAPGVYVHAKHETTKALNIQVNSDIDLNELDDYLLGMSCEDTCGGAGGLKAWSPSNGYEWVTSCTSGAAGNPFDATTAGDYFLQFTCVDDSGRIAEVCRTINNVGAKPIVSINCPSESNPAVHDEWCDQLTIEAHGTEDYEDAGASCSDIFGDGDNANHDMISENVIVSGDIVQMSVADTYLITYVCSSAFNSTILSEPAVRTVIVIDTSTPECDFGEEGNAFVVEASFPYTDIPPNCTDVTLMADTVTTGVVDVELTGDYVLTYNATDVNDNFALFYRTVTVSDTLAPTIQLDLNFMAESSSNGWLIGAMVSAVTGVAIISFSTTGKVSTSVPV